jgi:hypothetical protein
MIEIDIILEIDSYLLGGEMICMFGALALIVSKFGLTHRGIVLWIMAWSIVYLLQLDEGGEFVNE